MDECCLLPSQLLVPNLDWLPASDGLVSRLQPKQPLRLRFGRVPTLPSSTSTLQLDGLTRYALPTPPPPQPLKVSTPQRHRPTAAPALLEPGVCSDRVPLMASCSR